MATQWNLLLNRALVGLEQLQIDTRLWTFGGGTALMLRAEHRDSKDIDLFIVDPQLIGYLSPRLTDEQVWDTEEYDEQTNMLKLRYPEGEIDIIVAVSISELKTETFVFEGSEIRIEHPIEIILKKLVYRDAGFKPRDIFDTAVVLHQHGDELRTQLHLVTESKAALIERISKMPQPYFEKAMSELDIRPGWEWLIPEARQMVLDLVEEIP